MAFLGKIRTDIGKKHLKKRLLKSDRKISYSGIEHVRKMCVVWDSSDPSCFKSLSKFHSEMAARNIDVKIIGYYNGKTLPDTYSAVSYFTCMRKADLNFLYKPVSPESMSFITTKYDILIDVNPEMVLPLYYITVLSEAYFKVGPSNNEDIESVPFDLMISLKKFDTAEYLNQVIHYLEMIKTKH